MDIILMQLYNANFAIIQQVFTMKKRRDANVQVLNKLSFLETIDDHPAYEWFKEHGQKLAYVILGLFLLLFIIYLWSHKSSAKTNVDYYQSYQIFDQFQKDPSADNLQAVEELLQRNPDLHSKYDGVIAQIIINHGSADKAMPFAEETLKRVSKDNLPLYNEFAAISLLSANGNDAEALNRAIALQPKLNAKEMELLAAYNLLRQAMLQQKVGSPQEELASWRAWVEFANSHPQSAASMNALFTESQLTLSDYANARIAH